MTTWSKEIYQIIGRTDHMFKLKNLNTGEEVKRAYHPEELSITFSQPPPKKQVVKRVEKPKLNPKETIAKIKEVRIKKIPVWKREYAT